MSTSKFMRLFREIEKSLPDEVPTDFTYQKEREEIIQTLLRPQFKDKNNLPELRHIGFKEPVHPSKHHGKGARTVQELNQTKKIINNARNNPEDIASLKKSLAIKLAETKVQSSSYQDLKKKIRVELKLHEENQPVMKEIESYVNQNQSIPPHLLIKLTINENSVNVGAISSSTKPKRNSSPTNSIRPTSSASSSHPVLPSISAQKNTSSINIEDNEHESKEKDHLSLSKKKKYPSNLPIYQKTLINNKNYIQSLSSFSSSSKNENLPRKKEMNKLNKWTKEEKEKINSIYLSIPPPDSSWPLGMWRLYLNSFADKFRVYYPDRKHDEVVDKVRDMIEKKQMKQLGEENYWKNLQKKKKEK